MVPLEVMGEHRHEANVAIFDVPGLSEDFEYVVDHLASDADGEYTSKPTKMR